jgi:carboxyl-terminal processing protease
MNRRFARQARALAAVLLALAAAAGCGPAAGLLPGPAAGLLPGRAASTARVPVDSLLAVTTFDTAWTRIRDMHYDPQMRGLDWNAVHAELWPRAARARTQAELRAVLSDMLGRLGESHFGLVPAEVADAIPGQAGAADATAEAGLELRLVDGALLVTRVVPGLPAERAGVRAGWAVESIAGRRPAEAIARLAALDGYELRDARLRLMAGFEALLRGPAGGAVEVALRDGADALVPLRLGFEARGEAVRVGNLPPMVPLLEHRRVRAGEHAVGVIRFNNWLPAVAPAFDRAIDDLRDTDGIILDLRGNTGGVAAMVMGTAGHFIDERIPLGVLRQRGTELRFFANPRATTADGRPARPFAGPLAILVDELSVSTSEIFAAGMRHVGRATLFGQPTPGQALPALLSRLPNGDLMLHVIADLTLPDGSRVEGDGVVPDQLVPLRREELLAGRDAALAAAVRWMTGTDMEPPAIVTVDAAEEEPQIPLPPAAGILERYVEGIGGADLVLGRRSIRMNGTFEMPDAGYVGRLELLRVAPGASRMRVHVDGYGAVEEAFDGEVGWALSPNASARLIEGAELDHLREESDLRAIVRHADLIDDMATVAHDEVRGRACWRVNLLWRSGRATSDCYDVESGMLLSTHGEQPTPTGPVQVVTIIEEWGEYGGYRYPRIVRQEISGVEQRFVVDRIAFDDATRNDIARPASVRALTGR